MAGVTDAAARTNGWFDRLPAGSRVGQCSSGRFIHPDSAIIFA